MLPSEQASSPQDFHFFFSTRFLFKSAPYFQILLHLLRDRLAFAVKAENYDEGLIDPLVSLKNPVCSL